jgi:predicted amidohydrolase
VTRVVCCQLAPVVADVEGNIALAERALVGALDQGADVIVLPEVVTSGYPFDSVDEARAATITREHPLFHRWRGIIGDAVLVFGFAELGVDGKVYNSAALVQAGAEPTFYRKTHLWDTEKLFFVAGDDVPPVVNTAVGRIAVMICYDLEFPEMTRSVALRGADLLAVPTNWPWIERPPGSPAPEVVIAMAAARVNKMAIACCDRTGSDRGQRWNEATTIIGADGWARATADGHGFAVAELDLAAGRDKHISTRNDLFTDRRPDIYRGTVWPGPVVTGDERSGDDHQS